MHLQELSAFKTDTGEHTVLTFRKHWFVLLQNAVGTALAILFPPIALALARFAGLDVAATVPPTFVMFLTIWWLLVVWLALSVLWTNYYLDLWLVTDKRLVSVDQRGLFQRNVTTLPLSNVQDVTVEQHGVIQTLLNFGTLTVQTAGPTTNNMSIRGVARPNKIRDVIVHECELQKQRASGITVPPTQKSG